MPVASSKTVQGMYRYKWQCRNNGRRRNVTKPQVEKRYGMGMAALKMAGGESGECCVR